MPHDFFILQEKEKTLQIIDLQGFNLGWRVGTRTNFLNFHFLKFNYNYTENQLFTKIQNFTKFQAISKSSTKIVQNILLIRS